MKTSPTLNVDVDGIGKFTFAKRTLALQLKIAAQISSENRRYCICQAGLVGSAGAHAGRT